MMKYSFILFIFFITSCNNINIDVNDDVLILNCNNETVKYKLIGKNQNNIFFFKNRIKEYVNCDNINNIKTNRNINNILKITKISLIKFE